MAVQIVMDQSGDMRHQFDPVDARAVTQAEARFKELTRAGFTAANGDFVSVRLQSRTAPSASRRGNGDGAG